MGWRLPHPIYDATAARMVATDLVESSRRGLLKAANVLDDGRNVTAHLNTLAAITSCDDILDAIKGHEEAERC